MKIEHVPGYDEYAQGWQRGSNLMADLATIIPVGKSSSEQPLWRRKEDKNLY